MLSRDSLDVRPEPVWVSADLFALIFPVTFTLKPFLARNRHSEGDVQKMYEAWVKSCLHQVTLWSHLYVKDGDY